MKNNWKKRLSGPACYIFGAGEYYEGLEVTASEIKSKKDSFVIAADGGSDYLRNIGIYPDICIGDFDSCVSAEGADIIKLNPIKDTTDMAEAIACGIERGFKRFFVYGGTGGRTSHTLANLQTMAKLSKSGIEIFIIGNNEIFTAVTDGSISFEEESEGYISVFAHSETCRGVCEKGLKYQLEDYILNNDYPLGVSNEFVGECAKISVREGTLVIVFSGKAVLK